MSMNVANIHILQSQATACGHWTYMLLPVCVRRSSILAAYCRPLPLKGQASVAVLRRLPLTELRHALPVHRPTSASLLLRLLTTPVIFPLPPGREANLALLCRLSGSPASRTRTLAGKMC